MEVLDYSEKWGKDIDEAVKLALIDLKCTKDQVKITVLEEPSKGFFGIGARLAKVRVELLKKQEPVKEEKTPEKKANEKKPAVAVNHAVKMSKENDFRNRGKNSIPKKKAKVENKKENKVKQPESKEKLIESAVSNLHAENITPEKSAAIAPNVPTLTAEPIKEHRKPKGDKQMIGISKFSIVENEPDAIPITEGPAIEFLNSLLQKMGLNLNVRAFEKNNVLYISIEGRDSGTIIGKRGQTLDAIQYLTSLVVNKDREKYIRVIVNAENYREKREITLEKLALRLADSVIKSRKSVRLEPMNPYERKVIHSTLQRNDRVSTRSEGEEPHRRVIIEMKR